MAASRQERRKLIVRNIFGVVSGRSIWGLEPYDFRPNNGVRAHNEDVESDMSRRQDHTTGLESKRAYHVPLRRHVWGERQYQLHASWGELFLDLIFVGAAYRLGNFVKGSFCEQLSAASASSSSSSHASDSSAVDAADGGRVLAAQPAFAEPALCLGPMLGLLYASAFFYCCLRLWLNDLHYRSRFEPSSTFHRALDLLGYLLLVETAASIGKAHVYQSSSAGATELATFIVPSSALHGLWQLRWLEIALRSHDEESRRFSAMKLTDDAPSLLWWAAALLLAFQRGANQPAVPCLLLVGAMWSDMRMLYRVQRAAFLRWADPDGEARHLSKDRTRVPLNVEFAIHRFYEFMMLMIGEGVLQLVLADAAADYPEQQAEADAGGTISHSLDGGRHASVLSGFTVCISLLYSFNITEPHHAIGHAFARSSRPAALYLLLLPPKALSILLSGVGVKLTLYQPRAYLAPSLVLTQRLQLALSLGTSFALQLIRQPLHTVGVLEYYSPRTLASNPLHALTIIGRIALVGLMVGACWTPTEALLPWHFLLVQAGLAALMCLLHFGETRLPTPRPSVQPGSALEEARRARRRRTKASCMIKWGVPAPSSSSATASSFSGLHVPVCIANVGQRSTAAIQQGLKRITMELTRSRSQRASDGSGGCGSSQHHEQSPSSRSVDSGQLSDSPACTRPLACGCSAVDEEASVHSTRHDPERGCKGAKSFEDRGRL